MADDERTPWSADPDAWKHITPEPPRPNVVIHKAICMSCLVEFTITHEVPTGQLVVPMAVGLLKAICRDCSTCRGCGTDRVFSFHATPQVPHAAHLCVECGRHWHGPELPPSRIPT